MQAILIPILLTAYLAQLFVRAGLEYLRRKNSTVPGFVHLPNILLPIGLTGAAIMTIMTWTIADSIVETLCFVFFAAMGIILILAWKNCTIYYDEHSFTQSMFLGIKRTFTYDQVTAYGGNGSFSDILIYVGTKKVRIDNYAFNGFAFLDHVAVQYFEAHGREIPAIKQKFDLFNGHIANPAQFVFIFMMIGGLIVAPMLYFYFVGFSPYNAENTEHLNITFNNYGINGGDLYLSSRNYEERFELQNYADTQGYTDTLTRMFNRYNPFEVWAKRYSSHGTSYYKIVQLASEGTFYYTFEDANRLVQKNNRLISLVFAAFLLIWLVYCSMMIYVGRNADHLSKRLVHAFFKDESILQ